MIIIAPTTTTTTTVSSMTATGLWIDSLSINASSRNQSSISMTAATCPYAADANGNPIQFASENWPFSTTNLQAAAANLAGKGYPQLAAGITAVYAAMGAINAYYDDRQTDFDNATVALATANTNVDTTNTAMLAAYTTAQATGNAATDPTYLTARAAWRAAQTAVVTAQTNVQTATAALSDAANPPLVVAP